MSTEQNVTAPFSPSFDRDLENARVLIEELPWKENPKKYRKVAETIIRRVLSFDPTNEVAKRLLEKTVEIPVPEPEATALRPNIATIETASAPPKQEPVPAPTKVVEIYVPEPPPHHPVAEPEFSFSIEPPRPAVQPKSSGRPPWVLVAIAMLGAIAGLTLLVTHRGTFTSGYPAKTPAAAPAVVQAKTSAKSTQSAASATSAATVPATPPVVAAQPVPVPLPPQAAPKSQPVAVQSTVVVKSSIPSVAPLETGTLAVSSPTTVDIYRNDQLIGSAPTTLVLPAGDQTLEYRHQDMRKVLTYVIKANDTTTAMVTFDVTVQINAKPWAQVFIDGSKREPLGQTPLSDVRVPIGTNLVFENPNFPGKTYRITGRETQIRVSFP
jgi:hypothetical protein